MLIVKILIKKYIIKKILTLIFFFMHGLKLRKQIEIYDLNEQDLIRRAYTDFGPY